MICAVVEERPSPFSSKDQSLFIEPMVMGGRLVGRLEVFLCSLRFADRKTSTLYVEVHY